MNEKDWFGWKGTTKKLSSLDYPEPETVITYREKGVTRFCRVYGDVKKVTHNISDEGNFYEVELPDGSWDRLQPKYGRVWVRGKVLNTKS